MPNYRKLNRHLLLFKLLFLKKLLPPYFGPTLKDKDPNYLNCRSLLGLGLRPFYKTRQHFLFDLKSLKNYPNYKKLCYFLGKSKSISRKKLNPPFYNPSTDINDPSLCENLLNLDHLKSTFLNCSSLLQSLFFLLNLLFSRDYLHSFIFLLVIILFTLCFTLPFYPLFIILLY